MNASCMAQDCPEEQRVTSSPTLRAIGHKNVVDILNSNGNFGSNAQPQQQQQHSTHNVPAINFEGMVEGGERFVPYYMRPDLQELRSARRRSKSTGPTGQPLKRRRSVNNNNSPCSPRSLETSNICDNSSLPPLPQVEQAINHPQQQQHNNSHIHTTATTTTTTSATSSPTLAPYNNIANINNISPMNGGIITNNNVVLPSLPSLSQLHSEYLPTTQISHRRQRRSMTIHTTRRDMFYAYEQKGGGVLGTNSPNSPDISLSPLSLTPRQLHNSNQNSPRVTSSTCSSNNSSNGSINNNINNSSSNGSGIQDVPFQQHHTRLTSLGESIPQHQSANIHELIFMNAPTPMSLSNVEGTFMAVNRQFCDMLGYTEEEIKGRNYTFITFPLDLDYHSGLLRQMKNGEIHSFQFEKRLVHKYGHVVGVTLQTALTRDCYGNPNYFIDVITERRYIARS